MTEADIKRLVSETVAETLTRLGIEADNPGEMQRDFQHLREWRESIATVKRQSLITAVGILTAGFLGLLWMVIRGGGNG